MTDLPFGFAKPHDSPGFLLWQTTITWQRLLKKIFEPYRISHAQFVIMALLLWLDKHGFEPNQVLIANWSKLDKMTVSKSLKNLATDELVTREEHKTDTRAKTISLTPKGIALINKIVPLIEQADEEFFSALIPKEQTEFIKMLNKLADK